MPKTNMWDKELSSAKKAAPSSSASKSDKDLETQVIQLSEQVNLLEA